MKIHKLLCEGLLEPVGIDTPSPEFIWSYSGDGKQQKYQLQVWDEEQIVYDSGMVNSHHNRCKIAAVLEEEHFYSCLLNVIMENGRIITEKTCFRTGLFSPDSWKAQWITGGDYLRKDFETLEGGVVKRAYMYYSGVGYCEAYLNGKAVNDYKLFPSYTMYNKRVEYAVTEITDMLAKGNNAVGLFLGGHWPVNEKGYAVDIYSDVYYQGRLMGICQIRIEYEDGRIQWVLSDDAWRAGKSPVLCSSVYDGEQFDGRLYEENWCAAGYETKWKNAVLCKEPIGQLCLSKLPPIRVTKEWNPVSVKKIGRYIVLDFGVNHTGWIKIKLKGKKGSKVIIKYGELLYDNGLVNQENLRNAKATDIYYMGGDEAEYAPRFTYHGFRYVQIEGEIRLLEKEDIITQEVHSDLERTGYFSCSDPALNQIYQAMVNTLISNMHSIPTDCCQRDERQGWIADAALSAELNMLTYDGITFYRKWLLDIQDSQSKDGNLPLGCVPGWERDSFIWKSGYARVLFHMYQLYGDRECVRVHYPILKKYEEYLQGVLVNDLVAYDFFSDWLTLENPEDLLISNLFLAEFYRHMEKLAVVVGDESGIQLYKMKKERTRRLVHEKYYGTCLDNELGTGYYGRYENISVAGNALALLFGIVPEKYKERTAQRLYWLVTKARGSVQLPTGLITTGLVVQCLSDMGWDDVVYAFFKRKDYPSFQFMLDHGATTIWERWQYLTDNEMNSQNQLAMCSAGTWFMKGLCGLRKMEVQDNGMLYLELKPYCPPELSYAQYSYKTLWGEVFLRWERKETGIEYHVKLPVNTEAVLKGSVPKHFESGEHFVMLDD